MVLRAFLGPVKNTFSHRGRARHSMKLEPKICDFKAKAYGFGLSTSPTSTWICFLYQTLKEIEWMPTIDQVMWTLPTAFRPKTYALVDASEVFIETLTDLSMANISTTQ